MRHESSRHGGKGRPDHSSKRAAPASRNRGAASARDSAAADNAASAQGRASADASPRAASARGSSARDRSGRQGRDYAARRPAQRGGSARASGKAPRAASAGGNAAPAAQVKERYPKAEFARRDGIIEGLPAVMEVNRALKWYAFKKDFEWCLRLAVAYNAGEDGLPLAKEEQALQALEQRMFGLLKKSVNGHYVGHTSWGGSREFVFYIDEGSEAEEPLNAFAAAQKRPLEFSLERDTKWTQVGHYFNYTD